jgi:hypothetical protein
MSFGEVGIMIDNNKCGFIDISDSAYNEFWFKNQWFVPLSIETQLYNRTKRVLCLCQDFRKLDESEAIPSYSCTFKELQNGQIILSRVEEESGL